MGVRGGIARRAVQRSHVLVVEVPGWGETRMRVEAEIARRGWATATSPADADVLLICGEPGQELRSVCSRLWSQLPGPRARAAVFAPGDVVSTLESVAAELLDDARHRHDARTRSHRPTVVSRDTEHTQQHARGDDNGSAGRTTGDTATDMDADTGMDMDMDMPRPGGIPLATGGGDRDGLEMDVLHVPLGPVLPHWPAGLVVRCVLQGDVIQSAEVEVLGAAAHTADGDPVGHDHRRSVDDEWRKTVIRRSDWAMHVLALSGWSAAAGRARRIRDDVASGMALLDTAASLERLARSVKRSWLLGWTLKGLAVDQREGVTQGGTETVRCRLIDWLETAGRLARDARGGYDPAADPADDSTLQQNRLEAIPGLLNGTDLASARLIIAGLAIDTSVVTPSREPLA